MNMMKGAMFVSRMLVVEGVLTFRECAFEIYTRVEKFLTLDAKHFHLLVQLRSPGTVIIVLLVPPLRVEDYCNVPRCHRSIRYLCGQSWVNLSGWWDFLALASEFSQQLWSRSPWSQI
jgi:hypothetical protein